MSERTAGKRLVGWLIRHPVACLSFVVLLIAVATLALIDRAAVRRLEAQIAAIRERNEPVSADDLRAFKSPVPEEENLAIALFEAVRQHSKVEFPAGTGEQLELVGKVSKLPPGQRAPAEMLDAISWYLSLHPGALDAIHKACERRTGFYSVDWKLPLTDTPLPELSLLRTAAELCSLDAMLAAHQGDMAHAAMRIRDGFRIARAMDENTYLPMVAFLVRNVCASKAAERMVATINCCGMEDADLAAIQKEAEQWCNVGRLAELVMVERASIIEMWKWLRATPANPLDVERYMPARRLADEEFAVEALTRLAAGFANVENTKWAAFQTWRESLVIPEHCLLFDIIVWSFNRSIAQSFRLAAHARALQTAIACERFRLANGHWPHELNDLVPEYLPQLPSDPFDAKPLRYTQTPDGIKVWSIGDDERDDGGDLLIRREGDWSKDVGWFLLNPELRARPAPVGPN